MMEKAGLDMRIGRDLKTLEDIGGQIRILGGIELLLSLDGRK